MKLRGKSVRAGSAAATEWLKTEPLSVAAASAFSAHSRSLKDYWQHIDNSLSTLLRIAFTTHQKCSLYDTYVSNDAIHTASSARGISLVDAG
jgi:hypothetical protein